MRTVHAALAEGLTGWAPFDSSAYPRDEDGRLSEAMQAKYDEEVSTHILRGIARLERIRTAFLADQARLAGEDEGVEVGASEVIGRRRGLLILDEYRDRFEPADETEEMAARDIMADVILAVKALGFDVEKTIGAAVDYVG